MSEQVEVMCRHLDLCSMGFRSSLLNIKLSNKQE